MARSQAEKVVTKRRVTMRSIALGPDGTYELQATDYVRPDVLDAYVADARTRWQSVEVSEEPDAGPAGYDGATFVPPGLAHPLAGTYFPATGDKKPADHAPEGARIITED